MDGENDKLGMLRDKLMKQRRELVDKIGEIDSKLSRVEEVWQMLLTEEISAETVRTLTSPEKGRYATATLQNAVLDLVTNSPDDKVWSPKEIASELRRQGLQTTSKNFVSVVISALLRLADKGRIEATHHEGKRGKRFKKKASGGAVAERLIASDSKSDGGATTPPAGPNPARSAKAYTVESPEAR